ncbi:LysR family transcriptional regulator [Photobacterium phosphoreum]|uniref:LysR family transcriptional regulator n=1 Tax=Photobacterium phosphoreum TaxID=659 RepID=UPI0007F89DDE|nr:LysR family transcriptional regulator [Photobacterium phosphoreum]OBU39868.1 LysR family transcriptional regulator [Photobacterium phosphoreum]PSU36989.1 LysR family transcriptional regulator [Photobacterium phosphoreum]PSU78417.1 LysR family transcriptional regulator [Photobacterium phosphoreum]
MINPQWLTTFKTLIETGHFTQTADILHMTQPGVSQHIKKLEQACGYQLITRYNKQFEITEQGLLVYQYAQQQTQQYQTLLHSLQIDSPYDGICRLACSGSFALSLYPQLLRLQQQYPKLHFHLEAAPNHKILDDIENNTIDMGIVTQEPVNNQLQATMIGQEPLCLVLPLRYKNSDINIDLLTTCGLINHPDAQYYLTKYFHSCGHTDLATIEIEQLPITSYINQLSQILIAVAEGIGFTVLPQSAIAHFADKDKLYIAPPLITVTEALFIIQKRHRYLPVRYQTVTSLLVSLHQK